jgi:hypothetical protein
MILLDEIMHRQYCAECHCRLYAMQSRKTGVCTECTPGFDENTEDLDLEERLDSALSDEQSAVEIPKENQL